MPMTSPPKRRGGGGPLDPGDEIFANPFVPNVAALIALPIGVAGATSAQPEGWEVYVNTLRCKWRLRTTAVAPVAFEIVTSTSDPTRQWWREDCGGAPGSNPWLNQLAWVVSPAGNDEALGTAAAPLLTFAEFERRLRGARLNAVFTVQALGALAAIEADVDLGPLGMLVIDGNLGAVAHPGVPPAPWPAGVQLAAAAAYTAANVAGQQFAIVDVLVPALFDWTPYVGARVRCSPNAFPHAAGPLDRCTFIVESVNPAGGGNNTARVTIPNGLDVYDPLGPVMTWLVPLNNDFLYAELLPDSGPVVLDITKQAGATLPSVNITGFNVSAPAAVPVTLEVRAQVPTALFNPAFGRPVFFGCTMNVMQSYEPLLFWECGFVNPGAECQISGKNGHEMTQLSCCGFLAMNVATWNCSYTANLWQASQLRPQPGFHDFPVYNGFFDQVGDNQIVVSVPGVSVAAAGALFGVGANRGLYVMTNGFHMSYVIAPTLNVGGVSEFRVMGVEYTWAANVPFPDVALVYPVTVHDVSIFPQTV